VTWRLPRFTTLQLLLAAGFCALVLGLATASWRSTSFAQVTAVGFSPGGRYLAARYASGFILVWDVSDSRPRRVASFASSSPWAFASGLHFADDHTLVDVPTRWTGSAIEGEVRTLDLTTGRVHQRLDYQGTSQGVLLATGGDIVAQVNWPAGNIACYSLSSGRLVQKFDSGVPAWSLAVTPDGRTLISPDQTGSVSVCDVLSGNVVHKEPAQGVVSAAISDDGRQLAFISWEVATTVQNVHVRDVQAQAPLRTVDHELAAASWLAFADGGSQLAIASYEAAEVHDLASGRRIGRVVFDRELTPPDWLPWTAKWRSHNGPSHFSISPDGSTLATFDGSSVHLWDTPSGKLRTAIADHSRGLQVVLFTLLFAAWSAIWGIVSRRQWLRATAAAAPVHSVSRTPIEVKLCWGLMLIGGLVSLGAPIAMLLSFGPFIWPMFYMALVTGVAAVARGAARDTRGLARIATLQLCNIAACDPVNFLLGTLAHSLLGRPHVRQFLQQTSGGQH
jgi:hypothetical protein